MKEKYPITLKRAKEIAKSRLGRLPRVGHSVVVGGVYSIDVPAYPKFRTWQYQLSLVNISGKFYLDAWQKPFAYVDMEKFVTLENES